MAAIMIRLPIMTEEPRKFKQAIPFILTEQFTLDGANGAELVEVGLGGRFLSSQTSINELGKQLLKAAGEGNLEEVKSLMSKGAAFTADWLGTTPLHLAAQNNHLEICEILLRAGISKDARTKVDRTPLHMAVYEGHIEIVETLLAVGADCDCKDMLLMTPLHWAAQNGHAEIAQLLIKYGATTELVSKFNLTPADIARQMERTDIVQLIESAARDPYLASHHLAIQLAEECNSDSNMEEAEVISDAAGVMCTPVETVLLEDDVEENQDEALNASNNAEDSPDPARYSPDSQQSSLVESLKILQQHGITMLPSEEHNILSSAVESGHSVVLTEVGKEVLNSLKAAEARSLPKIHPKPPQQNESKKYVTITPEDFFALTGSGGVGRVNAAKHLNKEKATQNVKQTIKRVVMKKNKTSPIPQGSNANKVAKLEHPTDMETVMKQLIEARNVIEEYKVKLMKKEAEAERYKQQLKAIMERKCQKLYLKEQ